MDASISIIPLNYPSFFIQEEFYPQDHLILIAALKGDKSSN